MLATKLILGSSFAVNWMFLEKDKKVSCAMYIEQACSIAVIISVKLGFLFF